MNNSGNESLVVDIDDKKLSFNKKLKELEKIINAFKRLDDNINLWSLKCYYFKNKSLKENVCKHCILIRAERGYHCKTCRRCVKKYDHHCIFINNCIGHSNYKLFINLLIYCTCILVYVCVLMIKHLREYIIYYSVEFNNLVYHLYSNLHTNTDS